MLFDNAKPAKSRWEAGSEHPLAIVRRHLSSRSAAVEERVVVVQAASRWADQGGNLEVAAEAAMASVNPEIDDSELDPVNQDRISIYYGMQPVVLLRELESVWDLILDFLRNHPETPPRFVLDGVHAWARPGTRRDGDPFLPETNQALRDLARRIIPELAELYADRPIVMRRLSRMARHVRLEIDTPSDQFIDALYALRAPHEDEYGHEHEEPSEGAKEALRNVARAHAQHRPSDLARKIVGIEAEATDVGFGLPPLLKTYVAEVATRLQSPMGLVRALAERRSHPWLVDAATSGLAPEPAPDFHALVEQLLFIDQYRRIGTRLALQAGAPVGTRALAISRLQPDQADEVVFYFRIGRISPHELQAIVEDSESRLGQEVALGMVHSASSTRREELPLTEALRTACRARVARYHRLPLSDTHQNWMLKEVLRSDPALCTEWIENWMKAAVRDDSEWLPHDFEDVADTLATDEKRRLIKVLPPQLSSVRVGRLVRGLVNGDDELIRQFLSRDELEHQRDAMFEGELDESWLRRAELARQAGCDAEQIAHWTTSGGFGWSGDESAEWERRIGLLEELRRLALNDDREAAIDAIDACIIAFGRRKSYALKQEKQERIFGHSW